MFSEEEQNINVNVNDILSIQKPFILNRLENMKRCLEVLNIIDFTLPPFVSEQYADFDPETYDHPLWFAYINYRPDIVKLMLEKGYHPDEVETFFQNRTLLHLAAFRHDKDMCRLLISYGANIFAKNRLGEIPLTHAGIIKGMSHDAKKELHNEFSYKQIKNFRLFMKNYYFSINRNINRNTMDSWMDCSELETIETGRSIEYISPNTNTADPWRAWILPSLQASSISTNLKSGDAGSWSLRKTPSEHRNAYLEVNPVRTGSSKRRRFQNRKYKSNK
jgi:hypothetical protein